MRSSIGRRPISHDRSPNSRAASRITTISRGSRNGRSQAMTRKQGTRREPSFRCSGCFAGAPGRGLKPEDLGLGVGQRRQRQDPCPDPAGGEAPARGNARRRRSCAWPTQRPRRPIWPSVSSPSSPDGRAFRTRPSRRRSSKAARLRQARRSSLSRGNCSPARSRRRAGSRFRRCMPSRSGCCRLFPVRGQCPGAFQGHRRERGSPPDARGARPGARGAERGPGQHGQARPGGARVRRPRLR